MRGKTFTLLLCLLLGISSGLKSQTVSCPPNIDFEFGNFTNWYLYTGTCCPIAANTLSGPVANRHVITSGTGTDPYGGFPVVAPGSGIYSLKLGNNSVNKQAERARYYVHVPAGVNNYSLIFRYAVVFEEPGHTTAQQPRFEVKAYDSVTGAILPCSQFTFVATSNLPGFQLSTVTSTADVWYKSWTTASIDLSGYAGKTVAVDFASGDCALGAHFGYGYVDMNCGLLPTNTVVCSYTPTFTISAPPGFAYYEWRDSALTTILDTGQTGTFVTPTTNKTYAVILTPYAGFGCPDTIYTNVTISNVTANITNNDTIICNGTTLQLNTTTTTNAAPLTYSWTPATGLSCTNCTSPVVTLPVNNKYFFTVTNKDNCSRTDSVLIRSSNISVSLTKQDVACFNGTSGTMTAIPTGGKTPYTYSWNTSPVQTTATATGLPIGTYTVTVTDSLNCSKTATDTIKQPTLLTAVAVKTDASCYGGSNGTATVTASGGTAPYTYSWNTSPVKTTAAITGLAAGTYTVTVTDAKGCTATATITVGQPTQLSAVTIKTDVSCYGGNNGTATVTATGGTVPYTYSWNTTPVKTTAAITGLTAGAYTVTVTDANNCTTTATATVGQPAQVAATTSKTDVSCNGGNNGTATVSASGGTSPYTYSWNTLPAQTSATATGLAAGTYTVTVKDILNCSTTATVTVGQPTVIAATTTKTDVSCNGGSNGTATVAASGGTSPYTYSWNTSPVQTTATATGLPAGTYTVTVTDANSCVKTATVTIGQSTALTATAVKTPVSCFGGNNGTATVTASGGTTPYTYSWNTSPVQTSATATGLAAGTYTVTVTDNHNCITTTSVTVDQPSALAATTVKTDAGCYGGANGTATVTASGGTSPYTYSWNISPVQTTATATGLAAGVYTVTVTDANNCTVTAIATIGQPAQLNATTSATNVSCNGGNNGTATVTVNGGTGAYTYSWNTTPVQTGATATSLAAGTYTVTVKDANNCSTTASATVTQPALLTATTAKIDVSCNGGNNGTATVTASGGTSPYTYSWNTTPVQATATATGFVAGTYTVTVKDANNCSATASVTINQPTQLAATVTKTDATCFNGNSGTATVTATGGAAPYTYNWSTNPVQTTVTAINLANGTYTVTVTDANGCTTTAGITIGQPNQLAATATKTDVSCYNGNNGTSVVTATGGTAPYTYSWNTIPAQTTTTATNLTAGTYTVTVTDAMNCFTTATVTISQPAALAVSATATNVVCYGNVNGSATATVTGGTAPYTYSWNTVPVQGSVTAGGLGAGTYTITVTDAKGCTATANATVTQPALLTASIAKTDVSCFAGDNGTATVTATGGTTPYTYSWNTTPPKTTPSITNLVAGSYTATITDNKGCTVTATAVISQPALLAASTAKTDASCYSGSNGTATVTTTGGTAPYTYSWNTSPVQTTTTATNLAAGTYTVTITDSKGCILTKQAVVSQPAQLVAAIAKTDASCYGDNSGAATVTATGGTTPYTYSWNTTPAQAGATATNLSAGVYTVTITDGKGCTANGNTTIGQPAQLAHAITKTDVLCYGDSNGTVTVTMAGGSPAYSYSWNTAPIQNTSTATGLPAGTYKVLLKDAKNCKDSATVIIAQPQQLQALTSKTNATCHNEANGSATVSASGGTVPYTYSWNTSPAQTGKTATGLLAGVYTVTVKDANGCLVSAVTDTIKQPASLVAAAIADKKTCIEAANGSAVATAQGGTGPYSYSWNTSPGQFTDTAKGLYTGVYTVTVTDANGCTQTANVNVDPLPSPTVDAGEDQTICLGRSVQLHAGGTRTYNWAPSGGLSCSNCATPYASPLATTIYQVIGADSNGCKDTDDVAVTIIPRVDVSAAPDIDICIGDPAQLQAFGGIAYIWSPETAVSNNIISNPFAHTDTSMTFKVVITENECFKDTLYQRVRIHPRPTVELGPDKKGIPGATIQLNADTTNTISIAWSPVTGLSCNDCYRPVATLSKTITYTATVSSGYCEAKDNITITVGCDKELFFIPNTFTPNGDGTNDRFFPMAEGVTNIDRFLVYDRWGEQVHMVRNFPPNDAQYGWDGTYKGEQLHPDVYVYYLEARCANGEKIFLKGDISLVR